MQEALADARSEICQHSANVSSAPANAHFNKGQWNQLVLDPYAEIRRDSGTGGETCAGGSYTALSPPQV